jgi:phospholipid transport system substrate-binding protein
MTSTLAFLRLLLIALLLAPFAGSARAQSEEEGIRALLEQRDTEIKVLLSSGEMAADQRATLKEVINGIIDFEALGKTALGSHWEGLSASQQAEYVEVFSDIVKRQSVADLDVYRSSVTYDNVSVDGTTARVLTTTTINEVATPVVYAMHEVNGAWLITDIVIKDVSTADGYARSFQSLIRKRGFDTLMEKLRARRDTSA